MKILHILPNLAMGGAENLVLDLLPQLDNENNNCGLVLFNLNKESILKKKLMAKGIKYYVINKKPSSIATLVKLTKIINGSRYHIVHSHLTAPQFILALLKFFRLINVPIITTEHNTWNRRREYPALKILDYFMYHQYQQIICISSGTQQTLLAWLPSLKKKTCIIPNGIELQKFKNATTEKFSYLKKTNDLLITNIASFDFIRKDQPTLIKAVQKLADVSLAFAGDGKDLEQANNLINELNLQKKVNLLGNVENIPDLLACTDIYVQCSQFEGFGLVVVEAMAAGIPCIVSNIEGMRNIVEDAALLFSAGDSQELANKIIELQENPYKRAQLIKKGLLIAEKYSIKKMSASYLELYKRLLNAKFHK